MPLRPRYAILIRLTDDAPWTRIGGASTNLHLIANTCAEILETHAKLDSEISIRISRITTPPTPPTPTKPTKPTPDAEANAEPYAEFPPDQTLRHSHRVPQTQTGEE